MRASLGVLLAGVLWLPGCTVHSALEADQRLVRFDESGPACADPETDPEPWRPARAEDVAGTFALVEIRGAAAASVLHMSYHFARDGRYSGSALVASPEGPRHQTVDGAWQLRDGMLCLGGDSPPASARVRGRSLELSTELGTVLLGRDR